VDQMPREAFTKEQVPMLSKPGGVGRAASFWVVADKPPTCSFFLGIDLRLVSWHLSNSPPPFPPRSPLAVCMLDNMTSGTAPEGGNDRNMPILGIAAYQMPAFEKYNWRGIIQLQYDPHSQQILLWILGILVYTKTQGSNYTRGLCQWSHRYSARSSTMLSSTRYRSHPQDVFFDLYM
jgi:hypothetical protein